MEGLFFECVTRNIYSEYARTQDYQIKEISIVNITFIFVIIKDLPVIRRHIYVTKAIWRSFYCLL